MSSFPWGLLGLQWIYCCYEQVRAWEGEADQTILGSFLTRSLGWTSILTSMATCKPSTIRTEMLVLCACPTCLGEAFFPPQRFPKCLLRAGAIPGSEVMAVSNCRLCPAGAWRSPLSFILGLVSPSVCVGAAGRIKELEGVSVTQCWRSSK